MTFKKVKFLYKAIFSKYAFIHVPKTGGTAFQRNISNSELNSSFTFWGHQYHVGNLGFLFDRKMKILSVREPFSWYASIYNQKILAPEKAISRGKNYPLMEDNSFHDFFYDVAMRQNGYERYSRWFKPLRNHHKGMYDVIPNLGFCTANLIWYGSFQKSGDVGTCCTKAENLAELLKCLDLHAIIRMEHIRSDIDLLLGENSIDVSKKANKLGFDVKLPKSVSGNFKPNYMDYYDSNMLEKVLAKDGLFYKALGYCLSQ